MVDIMTSRRVHKMK